MTEVKNKIEYRKVKDLVFWADNPRIINRKELDLLKKSIEKDPDYLEAQPLVLSDRTGQLVVISGNQRLRACAALGLKEVPTILFHCETEEEEVRRAMISNHNNGDWDTELLANKFSDYPLEEWLGSDWEKIIGEIDDVDPDELKEVAPEAPPEKPKSKLGDLYKLGDHYLLVEDSTKKENLERVLGGTMADLIVTDPPYNVAIKNSQGMTIENDNLGAAEFTAFINSAMEAMSENLKPGGAFYVWYGDREDVAFREACFANRLMIKQCLIWAKNTFTLGRQDYQWQHEPCLYGWKEGDSRYFIDDRTQATVIEDENLSLDDMTKNELKELLERFLKLPSTVIHEDKPHRNADHPTMKPIKLIGQLVKNSSRLGEIVLDPFGGSGSTLIACEQLGRKCRTIEYDPKYADVIIARWEELTGNKAQLCPMNN